MTRPAGGRPALLAAATGAATGLGWQLASRSAAGGGDRWGRRNYRDREVSLLLGPVVSAAAIGGLAAAGPTARRGALLAVGSAAAVGLYDDLAGDQHARGLGGHARALRSGRLTTGVVKLVVMTAAAAAGSWRQHEQVTDAAIGLVLVAGTANLVNLFDLRPGRAAKVAFVVATGVSVTGGRAARQVAAVVAGAAVTALPADLGERAMLGDAGAGALGAALGWALSLTGSRRRRVVTAAGVVALTALSERVSFSTLIDRQPVLRALDRLGRQPA